jgi:hypothetical protein
MFSVMKRAPEESRVPVIEEAVTGPRGGGGVEGQLCQHKVLR